MATDKDFEQVLKDCYDETNNALRVNIDAASDLTVTGELTVEQSSNLVGVDINKTGSGVGNALDIDNDGTGNAIYARQDGIASAVSIAQNADAPPLVISGTYGNMIVVGTAKVPATAVAAGVTGSICWGTDAGTTYLYICIAANTWQRIALATW